MRGFTRWAHSNTKIEDGYSECFKKSAYKTAEQAEAIIKRRQKDGVKLRHYICTICSQYHLTKTEDRNKIDQIKETIMSLTEDDGIITAGAAAKRSEANKALQDRHFRSVVRKLMNQIKNEASFGGINIKFKLHHTDTRFKEELLTLLKLYGYQVKIDNQSNELYDPSKSGEEAYVSQIVLEVSW